MRTRCSLLFESEQAEGSSPRPLYSSNTETGPKCEKYYGRRINQRSFLHPPNSSALGKGLLAGLQESILRPEVSEYTLHQFEKKLQQAASTSENSLVALEKRRMHIEGKIENCTAAIADGQPPKFLLAKLADLEHELDGVNEQIETAKSGGAKSQLRETRTFVNERLRNLLKLLNGEPNIARAAISKHVQKIILTPEGRSYVATGEWDLLGAEKCGD